MAAGIRIDQLVRAGLIHGHAVGVDDKLRRVLFDRGRVGIELRLVLHILVVPVVADADIRRQLFGVHAGDVIDRVGVRLHAEALLVDLRLAVYIGRERGQLVELVQIERILRDPVLLDAVCRVVQADAVIEGELARPVHVGQVFPSLAALPDRQRRVAPLGIGGEICVGVVAGRRTVGLVDQLQLLRALGNVHADMAAVRRVKQLALVNLYAVGVDLKLAAALGIRLHVAAGLLPRLELGEFHADIAFKFHGVQAGNIVNDRRVRRDAEAFFKQNGRSRIAVHVDAGAGVARLLRAGIARRVAVPWIFGAVVFLHAESRAVRVVIVLRAHPFQVREIHAVSVCRGRPPDSGICLCVGCHAERRYHAQQQRRSQQERSDPFPILLHAFPFLFTYFSYRTTEAQLTPPAAPPR